MMSNKPLIFSLLAVVLLAAAVWTKAREAGGLSIALEEPQWSPDTDPLANPTTPR